MSAALIGVLAAIGVVSIAFAMGAGLALIEEHLKHWVREEENNAKLD